MTQLCDITNIIVPLLRALLVYIPSTFCTIKQCPAYTTTSSNNVPTSDCNESNSALKNGYYYVNMQSNNGFVKAIKQFSSHVKLINKMINHVNKCANLMSWLSQKWN